MVLPAGETGARPRVSRIGWTPVKGGRHRAQEAVRLTPDGPHGDRAFCLVDPVAGRCLRTVENPALLQTSASWDGTVLAVELPAGAVVGEPERSGDVRKVDYWGRAAVVELVDGPWSAAYSRHLGREVVLAACAAGEVVYGASVTLVTSGSLAWLAQRVGAPVDGARFRATLELDTGDLAPFVEEDWLGRVLRVGTAELRVSGLVPRCAVIDLDPATGMRDLPLLKALAVDRRNQGEVPFGVYADVTAPGQVSKGDAVRA